LGQRVNETVTSISDFANSPIGRGIGTALLAIM
jgi:hypothetical protein